jgi:hypothetical protein
MPLTSKIKVMMSPPGRILRERNHRTLGLGFAKTARSGKKGSKECAAPENKHVDGAGAEVSFCREK